MIDSHCHIHDDDYQLDPEATLKEAAEVGVSDVICVGTDVENSKLAVDFVNNHPKQTMASVGVHPHFASTDHDLSMLNEMAAEPSVVAVGECGLDYYYDLSPRAAQKELFKNQLEIAANHNLPVIIHVRNGKMQEDDAFKDLFEVFDEYDLTGVVHSFSSDTNSLEQILSRNLFVGVNGIATFMKDSHQIDAIKAIPLDKMIVETDAPLLTPVPFRGTINQPKHIVEIIKYLSQMRDESFDEIAAATEKNTELLFKGK